MDTTPQVRPWLLVTTIITVAGGMYLAYDELNKPVATTHVPMHTEIKLTDYESAEGTQATPLAPGVAKVPTRTTAMAAHVKRMFEDGIQHPLTQVSMLRYLSSLAADVFGDGWEKKLRELLTLAFPERVEALLVRYEQLKTYLEWQNMNAQYAAGYVEDRRWSDWDKRFEIFGDDAKLIFQEDYKAYQLESSLRDLDESTDDLESRSQRYASELRSVYGQYFYESLDPVIRQTAFLTLPSTQRDLANLSPEERVGALRRFREAIGMEEAAVDGLEALDSARESERQAGSLYMQERDAMVVQYTGDELQTRLEELRGRWFPEGLAAVIKNEESAGYFRYAEKVVLGVN